MNGRFPDSLHRTPRRFADIRPRQLHEPYSQSSRQRVPSSHHQGVFQNGVSGVLSKITPSEAGRSKVSPTSSSSRASSFSPSSRRIAPKSEVHSKRRILRSVLTKLFRYRIPLGNHRMLWASVATAFLFLIAWTVSLVLQRGISLRAQVLGMSTEGYHSLSRAIVEVKQRDFSASSISFLAASSSFGAASDLFGEWNDTLVDATGYFPGLSKISSGKHLVEASKDIAQAGAFLSKVGKSLGSLGNPLDTSQNISLLEVFRSVRADLSNAESLLSGAEEHIALVHIEDIPQDKQKDFVTLSKRLPEMVSGIRAFLDHSSIFADLLGENGPRRFLFLFENNQEMRATGGFIGSYAFLDIANGKIREFFVDGIFNPDGQLREDIVPPEPIQKISTGWSLHDSNWFPDFPISAQKAKLFYEKTGGPTVDGVIAFTPDILRKFLEITGPIRMDKYGVTIDKDNVLRTIQYQVEVAYDRVENRPKQILSDLAPILLDRVFGETSSSRSISAAIEAIESGFSEKYILFYSENPDMQRLISHVGWSGEILPSRRDYLSVINSNINGFKTDGVIDESIDHQSEIRDDGSIVNTVRIRRMHRGGKTGYEWWDRVNADYMRVYVPLGSKLLSASGHTKEIVHAPVDYDALHFSRDTDIERERRTTHVDPVSGTRISKDAGKTVFGNWVYVSPGETVEVTYSYLLPFRIDPDSDESETDVYSLVVQKQSGSRGDPFISRILVPREFSVIWQTKDNLIPFDGGFRMETDLTHDRFLGILLSR